MTEDPTDPIVDIEFRVDFISGASVNYGTLQYRVARMEQKFMARDGVSGIYKVWSKWKNVQ